MAEDAVESAGAKAPAITFLINDSPRAMEKKMQSYLFIGGDQDGRNIPLQSDAESIQLPAGTLTKETYIRGAIIVGDVFIAIYRHESLTSEQVLDLVVKYYQAWAANQPGGRQG
jgi:hypothetical protein